MGKWAVLVMKGMREISCVSLVFIVVITMVDIFCRAIYKPIVGTYELVSFAGAVTIGLALPITAWEKGHIYMEFIVERLSVRTQALFSVITRVLVMFLFFFIGVALYVVGTEMRTSGEIALSLKIPVYPIVYAVSIVCFFLCIIYIFEIVMIARKNHE
jgi:TRAP-type C4-dicarboxylate transport system permease small subunit